MATYYFPKEQITIVDPTIVDIDVRVNIGSATFDLYVTLQDPSGSMFCPAESFLTIPQGDIVWDEATITTKANERLATYLQP